MVATNELFIDKLWPGGRTTLALACEGGGRERPAPSPAAWRANKNKMAPRPKTNLSADPWSADAPTLQGARGSGEGRENLNAAHSGRAATDLETVAAAFPVLGICENNFFPRPLP